MFHVKHPKHIPPMQLEHLKLLQPATYIRKTCTNTLLRLHSRICSLRVAY